jgi:hypothetical protein
VQQVLVRDPRRLGTALVAFGAVGVVLAALLALGLVYAASSTAGLGPRLETARATLAESLSDASFSVGRAALATANLGSTVRSSEQVLRDTSVLLTDSATAVDSVADALDISILGQRPFDQAAAQLRAVADGLAATASSTAALASDLVSNAEDLDDIETELRDLQTKLDEAAAQLEVGREASALVGLVAVGLLLVASVAAWLAIAAGLITWLGVRLRAVEGDRRPA